LVGWWRGRAFGYEEGKVIIGSGLLEYAVEGGR